DCEADSAAEAILKILTGGGIGALNGGAPGRRKREKKAKPSPPPDRRSSTTLGDKLGAMIAPQTATTATKAVQVRQAPPATLVIFGAGGDLTKRLVVPALYHLVQAGKLPDAFAMIGVDHSDLTTEQWRQSLTEMMQAFTQAAGIDTEAWSWLTHRMHY